MIEIFNLCFNNETPTIYVYGTLYELLWGFSVSITWFIFHDYSTDA